MRSPSNKDSISQRPSNKHTPLLPFNERRRAILGTRDASLLAISGKNTRTGAERTLFFKGIPVSSFDWNNQAHIDRLNTWISQVYSRAGKLLRPIKRWTDIEEAWFELFYHLSIAEASKRTIAMPLVAAMMNAFNDTFVGQSLDGGENVFKPRELGSFNGKCWRMCPDLRARLSDFTLEDEGELFVPKITFPMMLEFKEKKDSLVAKGIEGESASSKSLEDWEDVLENLAAENDGQGQAPEKEYTDDEHAAAEALLMLSQGKW